MAADSQTPEEKARIERFLTTYNKIDGFLRKALNEGRETGFSQIVRIYSDRNPAWPFREALLDLGELRNAIIHTHINLNEHLAVPVERIVAEIENIWLSLENPTRVYPKYKCNVATVNVSVTLLDVFTLVSSRDFSQFPVYSDRGFAGLLTENGITRWLAMQGSIVAFDEVDVKTVLDFEEKRINYRFISRSMTILEAGYIFRQNQLMEALLITQNGKITESLLGIITRWDVIFSEGEK